VGEAGVDLAERAQRVGEGALDRRLVADVAGEGLDLEAFGNQLLARLGGLVRIRAPDRDMGARLGQRPRHAEADAAVAPGYQGGAPAQIEWLVHVFCLLGRGTDRNFRHMRAVQTSTRSMPPSLARPT